MARVKFARGTQSAYNGLATKDADTIYLCTDTHNIFLGNTLVFEEDAFKNASISGKTVTFTTHGSNGTTGTKTLDLSDFATSSEVAAAVAQAVSSAYKPAGTIAKSGIVSALLVEANLGNVYNVSEAFTVGSGTGDVPASLFTDAAAGNSYPAGTNIVVINTAASGQTASYKFDVLSGFIDLSGYATKVNGATSGNFAALDANGNLADSGHKHSDYKTKQTAKTDPTANGTGNQFIASITQDENGEVTATKKTVQDGTTSQKGIVKLSTATNSTSTTLAATPSAVKAAYDLAAGKVGDVKVGTTPSNAASVVETGVAKLITESPYDAEDNKLATIDDVNASALEWTELGSN